MSYFDKYGRPLPWFDDEPPAGMTSPVRCAYCSTIYDLGTVTVTGRWADCTAWNTPCCGRPVDDRGETGWKSQKDYYPLRSRGDVR